MQTKDDIRILKAKIVFLSFAFNPGAIILGVVFYHYLLGKEISFISSIPFSTHLSIVVGVLLLIVNFWFVREYKNRIKNLEGKSSKRANR